MIHPPQTGALSLSFKAYFAILPVVLIAIATYVIVFMALEQFNLLPLVQALIDSAITALVAFAAHNYIVTGGTRRGFRALQTEHRGAFSAFLALSFFVVLAMHGLNWLASFGAASSAPPAQQLTPPSGGTIALIFGVVMIGLIVTLVLLGGFGTMFPAIVDGGNTSPAAAWNRKVKGAIAYRVVGAVLIVGLLSGLIGLVVLPILLGGDPRKMALSAPKQMIFGGVSLLLSFYLTVLIATILSKAYLGSYSQVTLTPPAMTGRPSSIVTL